MIPAGYARVLKQREMRTLLGGYSVSLFGDGMSVVSVAALALRVGAGPERALIAGRYSMIAELAEPDLRMAANTLMTSMDSLAVVVGPAVAGAVIAVADPSVLIAVDAASYVVLGVALSRLPGTDRPPGGEGRKAGAEGWRFLRRNPHCSRC